MLYFFKRVTWGTGYRGDGRAEKTNTGQCGNLDNSNRGKPVTPLAKGIKGRRYYD